MPAAKNCEIFVERGRAERARLVAGIPVRDWTALTFYAGETVGIRLRLVNSSGEPCGLPSGSQFLLGLASDFDSETPADLLVASGFNSLSDWSDADPAEGRLCWRINLADVEAGAFRASLWCLPPGKPPFIIWGEDSFTVAAVVEQMPDGEQSSESP